MTLTPVSARSCVQARRALSLLLDDEDALMDVRALAEHLGTCESCRLFAARVAAVTRAIRTGVDKTRRLAPTWTEGGRP